MTIIPCNQTTYFDVDDTLIMWSPTKEQLDKHGIDYITENGHVERFMPHLTHIEQLKKHAARGHTIIVWSAGGWRWAAEAVKILGLEQYVNLVIEKPTWIYDDKQPEEFIPKPFFFKVEE